MRLNNLAPVLAAALVLAACTSIAAPPAAAPPAAAPPAAAPPAAASEDEEPVGNLAELMRAILFPNSNFLFDVQVTDPGTPPEPGSEDDRSASALFSGIYTGWQVPQQAALALAEVEPLIMNAARKCENGKDAPVANEDYQKWARQLTEVARQIYAAAHEEDQEKVSDLTNNLAGACEDCHAVYRKYQDRCRR